MSFIRRFVTGTCFTLAGCGTTDPNKLDAGTDASTTPILEDAGIEDARSDADVSDATVTPLTR